jgi:MbtH protein
MNTGDEDTRSYVVLINEEEQYSLWLKDRPVPDGWRIVGPSGPKADCLRYVEEVWTDMRPLSLRQKMAQGAS